MAIFARRVEHALDVTVQRPHDTDAREHRWPAMLRNQQKSLHRGLPFFGIVLCLEQFRDVVSGVAQGDQLLALGQFDMLGKWAVP